MKVSLVKTGFGDFSGGESVKVVVRIRPFSELEKGRKD